MVAESIVARSPVMDLISALLLILAAPIVGGMARDAATSSAPALQTGRVRWLHKPRNRPALYVMRLAADPSVFKVGYTARRVETRAGEIAASKGPVTVSAVIRMPHAYAAEQLAHRRLRRTRGIKPLGGEWYRLVGGRRDRPERLALSAAQSVRNWSRIRFSWPEGTALKIFRPEGGDHA